MPGKWPDFCPVLNLDAFRSWRLDLVFDDIRNSFIRFCCLWRVPVVPIEFTDIGYWRHSRFGNGHQFDPYNFDQGFYRLWHAMSNIEFFCVENSCSNCESLERLRLSTSKMPSELVGGSFAANGSTYSEHSSDKVHNSNWVTYLNWVTQWLLFTCI